MSRAASVASAAPDASAASAMPVASAASSAAAAPGPLVEIAGLCKQFGPPSAPVRAVVDVGFTIARGETVGLVGESGSGKTTIGRMLTRLTEPSAGRVLYRGGDAPVDLAAISLRRYRPLRARIQMIFQDPYASLNPRLRIRQIIGEALDTHGLHQGAARLPRIHALLRQVGLDEDHAERYPHEFSGGQRQRIGIARALAVEPEFIVADEPLSALDVSIQAQVINLLMDLQRDLGLSYLFISHNLSVVEHISQRIAVMYLGKIVEYADKTTIFTKPGHPYTEALLSAVPVPDPKIKRKKIVLQGDVPSPVHPPSGCHFHTRCPYVMDRCKVEAPLLREIAPGQIVACHLR